MMNRLLKGSAPHCPPSPPHLPKGECLTEVTAAILLPTLVFCFIHVALCLLRVPNLHSQASPVTRAPSMPPVETSYIPPPPPLIQDYRHYYHTTGDLPDLSFLSFLQGDNQVHGFQTSSVAIFALFDGYSSLSRQHYNMVMAAAAAASASASDDHDLLLNRFLPYGSSPMLREQPGTPGSSTMATTNGGSNSGSTSSLVSSSSLRERDRDSHAISGLSRSSVEAAAAAIYGSISDVISLD